MAKTDSTSVTLRIPDEVLERVDAADGSRTEIIVGTLRARFGPHKVDKGTHHQSGPVLASAVPSAVQGVVPWSNLKGGKK